MCACVHGQWLAKFICYQVELLKNKEKWSDHGASAVLVRTVVKGQYWVEGHRVPLHWGHVDSRASHSVVPSE